MSDQIIQGILIGAGLTLAIVTAPLYAWLWHLSNRQQSQVKYWCPTCETFVEAKDVFGDIHTECGLSVKEVK